MGNIKGKRYETGFFLGRMQPLPHKGHMRAIDLGIKECEKFLVLVGSAQEYGTRKNPSPLHQRGSFLKEIYGDSVEICGIGDYPNIEDSQWGNYVLEVATRILGKKPELMVMGVEDSNYEYYNKDTIDIKIARVDRNVDNENISGTSIREALLLDNEAWFKHSVDERLHMYYDNLRYQLLKQELRFQGNKIGSKM